MGRRLHIDGSFFVLASICLMLLPLKWVIGAFLAAFFHECCHFAAICFLGGKTRQITIGVNGAVIDLYPLANGRELLCAAAGPAGSFLLLIFSRYFPELAVCGLLQGTYNLLPVYPLDGGRVFRCGLNILMPDQADKLTSLVGVIVSCFLAVCSIIWGFWPAVLPFAALIKVSLRKIPCKEGNIAVQ